MYEGVGNAVVELVIGLSNLLREEHTPGLVSAMLGGWLVYAAVHFGSKTWRRCRALRALTGIVAGAADDPAEFSDSLTTVNRKVGELDGGWASSPRRAVKIAWDEYRETFVQHDDGDRKILCNSVRPSQFFNLEDLHFGGGFWRVQPGLFVTIGLFLTFLGLISALHAMNTAEGVSEEAMTNLLTVASAKFIMSLTGLACSILFTVWLRVGTGAVERAIHRLNREIEKRLSFLSLESLAVEQVRATREQKDHFRAIGMELVAELGKPLREELPQTISDSIGNAMSPLIDRVGEMGTERVGDMVRDLSSRITTDVDAALRQAGEKLGQAGERLGVLVGRMDGSSQRMGSEMEGAIQRLAVAVDELRATMSEGASAASGALSDGVESILAAMRTTLEGIRENTADGARELADAAEQFREALRMATEEGAAAARERMDRTGDDVAKKIDDAGSQVRNAIEGTGREIAAITGEATARAGRDLLGPMGDVAQQMGEMVGVLENGVREMRRASDGVKSGAVASSDAAANFRTASQALVAASAEVKPSVERLESATRNLSESTRQVGESAVHSLKRAEQILEDAQAILGGERQAVDNTLEGLGQVVRGMKGQGDRLDDIDEKLGRAFENYRTSVEEAVGGLSGHVKEMQEKLTPALGTMREIVEQAERFVPEQRNGRMPGRTVR